MQNEQKNVQDGKKFHARKVKKKAPFDKAELTKGGEALLDRTGCRASERDYARRRRMALAAST